MVDILRKGPSGPLTPPRPLFGEIWVDSTHIDLDFDSNGAQENPFRTIAEAVTAITNQVIPVGRIHVAPGNYTSEPLVELPEFSAIVVEGAVVGLALLPNFRQRTAGNFTVPGAPATALAFRNCMVGSVTIVDGSAPGVSPLIYENCHFGTVQANNIAANVNVAISGISVANFSIDSTTVSSQSNGPLRTDGSVFATNTAFAAGCTEIRCGEIFASACNFSQNIFSQNILSEIVLSHWRVQNPLFTFTGAFGTFRVDGFTEKRFKDDKLGLVVNGVIQKISV